MEIETTNALNNLNLNQSFASHIQDLVSQKILAQLLENPSYEPSSEDLHEQFKTSESSMLQISQNSEDSQFKNFEFNTLRTYNQLEKKTEQLVQLNCMIQDTLDTEMFSIGFMDKEKLKSVQNLEDLKQSLIINKYQNYDKEIPESMEPIFYDRLVMHGIQIPYLNHVPIKTPEQFEYEYINYNGQKIGKNLDVRKVNEYGIFNLKSEDCNQFPCLLKFSGEESSLPKLNQAVKIIGVLQYSASNEQPDDDPLNQQTKSYYSQSIIPTIHVLQFQILQDEKTMVQAPPTPQITCARDELVSLFNEIFKGDQLITEYLLLNLISNIFITNADIREGKLVMNLFKVQGTYEVNGKTLNLPEVLARLLQNILPIFIYLPLELGFLNTNKFSPAKNYEQNYLEFGLLQFPKESKMFSLIDETQLQQGQLKENGIQNIQVLNIMLESQKLFIQSQYFQLEIPVNMSALILSEGKSFLTSDLQICFESPKALIDDQIIEESKETNNKVVASDKLSQLLDNNNEALKNQLINYFLQVKEDLFQIKVDEETEKLILQDFVTERQKQQAAKEPLIDQDTLSKWIILSKIYSASLLKKSISKEDYQHIRGLEKQRIQRLSQVVDEKK